MSVTVYSGDCLEVIPRLVAEGVVCDSVCCDPPYGINFMNRAWDDGVAFRPETWATISTIIRPGGFLLAFGGCRTYHRMACAIEDAGFVLQDCIMFLFGTGFPKHKSQLKPSYEPIVLAYKPGGKRTMQVDECRISPGEVIVGGGNGKGGFGSGLCADPDVYGRPRVAPHTSGRWPANVCHDGSEEVTEAFAAFGESGERPRVLQRNGDRQMDGWGLAAKSTGIVHGDSGSAARFFYCAKAGDLDRWTTTRQELTVSWSSESGQCQAVLLVATALSPPRVIAASGSTTADEWNTFLFGSGLKDLCRAASKSTIRMTTSSTTELKTWSWLTRSLTSDFTPVVTSSLANGSSPADDAESINLSISFTLAETASLPNASRVLSAGRFELSGREKRAAHPTVKPISLMEWLVKMTCPEGGLVLDCFAGTGTTGVAAIRARRNAILIEKELSYVADICERLAFYEGGGTHSVQAKNRSRKTDAGPLFAEPYDPVADGIGSHNDAIAEIGRRVKAGEPLPEGGYFTSKDAAE